MPTNARLGVTVDRMDEIRPISSSRASVLVQELREHALVIGR